MLGWELRVIINCYNLKIINKLRVHVRSLSIKKSSPS